VSYKSLKEIYSENVVGKPVPPLPRQSVRLFIKEEDEAIKVYKQEADSPATLEGEVDKEYYDDVISPAITRGGNTQLAKIVKQRLNDAGCFTTRNYNLLVDFTQSLNITLTEKIFSDCESLFISSLNQPYFTFVSVLAQALQSNGQPITTQMIMGYPNLGDLKKMLATEKTSSEDRSGNAGPGEVFIAFFTNGKKLYFGKKVEDEKNKGDIEVGGIRMELKGIEGRLKINSSSYPIPPTTYFNDPNNTSMDKIRYLAFGQGGKDTRDFEPFQQEVEGIIAGKDVSWKEARNIASCIAFKVYCLQNRLSYFIAFNQKHNDMGCMPIQVNPEDSLKSIQSKIGGKFYLAPSNKEGHSLELDRSGPSNNMPVRKLKKKNTDPKLTAAPATTTPAPIPAPTVQPSQPQPAQGTPDENI